MAIFRLSMIICFSVRALAQIPSDGSCPEVEIMRDFVMSKFMGKWYEIEQYFVSTTQHVQCVTYDWMSDENGDTIRVETFMSLLTGIRVSTPGVIKVPDTSEPANLRLKYIWSPVENDYLILATDYNSYAVIYNCINGSASHNRYAWILTRDENPTDSVNAKISDVIEKYNLDRSKFTKTKHPDCERKKNILYPSTDNFPWACTCFVANIIYSLVTSKL